MKCKLCGNVLSLSLPCFVMINIATLCLARAGAEDNNQIRCLHCCGPWLASSETTVKAAGCRVTAKMGKTS